MTSARLVQALVMSPSPLLFQFVGNHLTLTDLVVTSNLIAVGLVPSSMFALCPVCGRASDRVHSRYRRVLADLPVCGRQLILILHLRKLFCTNAGCQRRIFCERIPDLAAAHARSTARLAQQYRNLGLALGGEPASRLSRELAMPASGDTILRRVKATVTQPEPRYRFIGIDDFALRKGHTYGTIVIDLERHCVIDLFDGRDGSAVETWLLSHPTVEIITRDRWAAYANACSAGVPMALQVADRFHLVGNIRELVERVFEHHGAALDTVLKPATPSTSPFTNEQPLPGIAVAEVVPTTDIALEPAVESPSPAKVLSHRQQQRQARFEDVRRMRREGQSVRQIKRALRISTKTILNYTRRRQCPDWNPGVQRASSLDGFRAVVDAFIGEGGRVATVLYRRLKDRGCKSSYDTVRRFLYRRLSAAGITPVRSTRGPPHPHRPTARQLAFEFVRRAEKRSEEATERMEKVKTIPVLWSELKFASELLEMTRGQSKTPLSDWLARADATESRSIQTFAETLRTDSSAVQAALSTSWSNGPVEGQVNRLKLIKRSGYGRAGLPLLRARVRAQA